MNVGSCLRNNTGSGGENMRNDNAGFSLVELIISIAIEAIVCLGILTLISFAARNYQYTERELNNQTEAQIVQNQVVDRVLQANNVTFTENTYGSTLTIYKIDQIGEDRSVVTEKQVIWWRNDKAGKGGDTNYTNKMFLFKSTIEGVAPPASGPGSGAADMLAALEEVKKGYYETGSASDLDSLISDINDYMDGEEATTCEAAIKDGQVTDDMYKGNLLSEGVAQFKASIADAKGSTLKDGLEKTESIKFVFGFKHQSKEYQNLEDTVRIRSKVFEIPD